MAQLKAHPKTYAQAAEYLAGRDSVKLGNNTWLERHEKEGTGYAPFIAVRLHNTNIVVFWESGRITLHTGGWYKPTTKDRINEFITGRVYQRGVWYYQGLREGWHIPAVKFEEGMEVSK
jgi:hypothetical protein